MSDEVKLAAIAHKIAERIQGRMAERPKLRLVCRDDLAREIPEEDPIMREHRIARIRWLARHYNLHVLVRQHTFGRTGIDALDAEQLLALHRDMESAFDTVLQGFPIDEAGFVGMRIEQ